MCTHLAGVSVEYRIYSVPCAIWPKNPVVQTRDCNAVYRFQSGPRFYHFLQVTHILFYPRISFSEISWNSREKSILKKETHHRQMANQHGNTDLQRPGALQIAPLPVARREHRENQHERNQRLHEDRLHPGDAHCHPVAAETLPVNLLPGHREQQRRSGHRPATLEGHVQNSPQQADFPRQKEGNRHRRVNMAAADARDAPDHRGHGQTEGDADPGHERVRTLRGVRGDHRSTAQEDQEARADKFGRERLPEGDLPEVLDAAAWIDQPHFDFKIKMNFQIFVKEKVWRTEWRKVGRVWGIRWGILSGLLEVNEGSNQNDRLIQKTLWLMRFWYN